MAHNGPRCFRSELKPVRSRRRRGHFHQVRRCSKQGRCVSASWSRSKNKEITHSAVCRVFRRNTQCQKVFIYKYTSWYFRLVGRGVLSTVKCVLSRYLHTLRQYDTAVRHRGACGTTPSCARDYGAIPRQLQVKHSPIPGAFTRIRYSRFRYSKRAPLKQVYDNGGNYGSLLSHQKVDRPTFPVVSK